MAYALIYNNTGYVTIPTKTSPVTGVIYDADWEFSTYAQVQSLTGNSLSATNNSMFINNATQIRVRLAGETTRTITLSTPLPTDTKFNLRIEKQTGLLTAFVDNVSYGTAAIGGTENSIGLTATYLGAHTTTGRNNGICYECNFGGQQYLNPSSPDTTSWGDGTLTGIPSTNWVEYGAGGGASNITITETLPALSDSMSMTFTPTAGTSNITINDTLPALDSSLSMTYASGVGTITISDWANNTGTALPSITDITVNVRSLVDGSTVYRTTTASTDVNADCVVSDAAIVSGTQYEVTALKFNGVDYDIGIAIITAT